MRLIAPVGGTCIYMVQAAHSSQVKYVYVFSLRVENHALVSPQQSRKNSGNRLDASSASAWRWRRSEGDRGKV